MRRGVARTSGPGGFHAGYDDINEPPFLFEEEVDGAPGGQGAHRGFRPGRGPGGGWDIFGLAVSGPLEGTQLEHVDTFWFAWAAYSPDTRIEPEP